MATRITITQAEWDVYIDLGRDIEVDGRIEIGWDGEASLSWCALYVYGVLAHQFRENHRSLEADAEAVMIYSALIDELKVDNVREQVKELLESENQIDWAEVAEQHDACDLALSGWDEV